MLLDDGSSLVTVLHLDRGCLRHLGSRKLYCVEDELGQIEVLDVDAHGLPVHA